MIWVRWLRGIQAFCVAAPIVFGALATWKILAEGSPLWASVFTLLATAVPPAYRALGIDRAIADCTRMSGTFTNPSRPLPACRASKSYKPNIPQWLCCLTIQRSYLRHSRGDRSKTWI
jgi:hypothetical protein